MASDAEPAPENAPSVRKPFSVSKYNTSVERKVKEFPKVWVEGIITQLQVRGKAAYLTLGEFGEGDAKPRAVLDVMLWASQLDDYNARFAQLPTPFTLRPELKVSFLIEASFYVPTGRFQPRVKDVDENFTLGELSLTRKKTLERLQQEGLIDRNKKLLLAEVPLRIGLITAPGSAAYQDFTTVLLQSGFSFQIFLASARMQGPATEDTVLQAMSALNRMTLDAICLVRGGGSKTDLVFFDSEKICRAIALCPVPVLTGIGHEIDRSLADVVAFADMLTPTDCAKFLESRLGDAWQGLRRKASGLRETWQWVYQETGFNALRQAEGLKSAWESRARREALRQAQTCKSIALGARHWQRSLADKLVLARTGLALGPSKISRLEVQALEFKERLLQSADPDVWLRRGFALAFSSRGKLIRSAGELAEGDEIRTQFADGNIRSRVQSKELK